MPAPTRPSTSATNLKRPLLIGLLAVAMILALTVVIVLAMARQQPNAPVTDTPSDTVAADETVGTSDDEAALTRADPPAEIRDDEAGFMPDFGGMEALRDDDQQTPSWASTSTRGKFYLAAVGRSPIPAVDETFDQPLPFVRLAEPIPQHVADAPADVLPWYQAEQHVGQTITIEGTIVHANNTGSVCFLNFDPNWREHFYIIIFAEAFPYLPDKPELYFMDKKVRMTGRVYRRNGRAQMRIEKENWAQISVVQTK